MALKVAVAFQAYWAGPHFVAPVPQSI